MVSSFLVVLIETNTQLYTHGNKIDDETYVNRCTYDDGLYVRKYDV